LSGRRSICGDTNKLGAAVVDAVFRAHMPPLTISTTPVILPLFGRSDMVLIVPATRTGSRVLKFGTGTRLINSKSSPRSGPGQNLMPGPVTVSEVRAHGLRVADVQLRTRSVS